MSSEYAGAGYIVELYNDLESLNGFVPQYQNYIIEVMEKNKMTYENFNPSKIRLDPDDKQKVLTIIPPIRHLIISIRMKMYALRSKIDKFNEVETEDFKKMYDTTVMAPSPDFKDVYNLCAKLNELFVNGIIEDMLLQARMIYSSPNPNLNQGGQTNG